MKTKLLSIAFTMLTVCAGWSQNATVDDARPNRFLEPVRSYPPSDTLDTLDHRPVSFPFWMVKAIALDLEEKSRLEAEVQLLDLELQVQRSLTAGLQENDRRKELQLALLKKNVSLLELQLKAERSEKPKHRFLQQGLRLLATLGVGFVLGRM